MPNVVNRQKAKGDKGERDAVTYLVELAGGVDGGLVDVWNPMRMLGAGRKEDIGDVSVFSDVAIQVKTWANVTRACREAADGAVAQARNGRLPHHLGLVPVPRARVDIGSLRYLAAVYSIPGGLEPWGGLPSFGLTTDAVRHLKEGYPGRVPLSWRGCQVKKAGTKTMYLMPLQAWLACFREDRNTNQ